MKLYLVVAAGTLTRAECQAANTRYVIVRDRRPAEKWREEIQRDSAGHVDYLVDCVTNEGGNLDVSKLIVSLYHR